MNENGVFLVVGATSGIGRSLALALAREGRRVAVVGRRPDALQRVAREVEMFGGEALPLMSDVRDLPSVQEALAQIIDKWGRMDTAFLSSGIAESTDAENFQSERLEEIIGTNLFGVAHWLEALLPRMRAQEGGGTVAVLSSLSADRAMPGGSANYSASKAAVSQLCDGLRAPWAKVGVRLVTVSPGFVRTPMTDGQGWLPFLMEPEDAARVILEGLRRGQSVIRFPKAAALATGLLRLLPAVWLDKTYRG